MVFLFTLTLCQQKEKQAASVEKPQIYNETADSRRDIQDACQRAEIENKHVLLMFGGNWCPWCHRLHTLFHDNDVISKILDDYYILVMINVNADRNKRDMTLNEQYGNPFQHGFPVLVVLDINGNQLTTQETGSLERQTEEGQEKGHDPDKVAVFLNKWKPRPNQMATKVNVRDR